MRAADGAASAFRAWRCTAYDTKLLAAAARRAGVKLVISTDAHSVRGLGVMRCGVLQARRAGLTAADVVNTLPWNEFRKVIGHSST
jgi:histidinol phosphatase-like PHP family hydrolase